MNVERLNNNPSPQERLQLMQDHAVALRRGKGQTVESPVLLEVLTERIRAIRKPDEFLFSGIDMDLSHSANGLLIHKLDEEHSIAVDGREHRDGFLVVCYGLDPTSKKGFMRFMIYGEVRPFADGQTFFARNLKQDRVFEQLDDTNKQKVLNWTSWAITRKIEAERQTA